MDKAIFELSEKLRYPNDLKKNLNILKKEISDQYRLSLYKLKTNVSESYATINNIFSVLEDIKNKLSEFKINKDKFISLLNMSYDQMKNDENTCKICLGYRNFSKIKNFIENISEIDLDPRDEDIEVYYRNVYNKEEFRCEIELYKYDLGREDYEFVNLIINKIEMISFEFQNVIFEVLNDFIENHEVLDKINKIIKKDEERDELARKAKLGTKDVSIELKEISKLYSKYITWKENNIKNKGIRVIKESIRNKFLKIDTNGDFVKNLYFVLDDLNIINKKVKLYFFDFKDFLKEYHLRLKEFIQKVTEDIDSGFILQLIEFKTNYYNSLKSQYNIIEETIEGGCIIENEDKLLNIYLKTVCDKLKYWIKNIKVAELEKFQLKKPISTIDENNKLISTGFINLMNIIKLQLESITFNENLLFHVFKTIFDESNKLIKGILGCIKKDLKEIYRGKNNPGFEDYCIMFGNSGIKISSYIYSYHIDKIIDILNINNIFINFSYSCNSYLIGLILHTCKTVTNKIFTNDWSTTESTKVFIITIEDFITDYKRIMADFLFNNFVIELAKAVANIYVQSIKSNDIVINENSSDILKNDYLAIKDFFLNYLKQDKLEEVIEPIKDLEALLEFSNDEIFQVLLKSLKLKKSQISSNIIIKIIEKRFENNEKYKNKFIDTTTQIMGKEKTKKKKSFISKFL